MEMHDIQGDQGREASLSLLLGDEPKLWEHMNSQERVTEREKTHG